MLRWKPLLIFKQICTLILNFWNITNFRSWTLELGSNYRSPHSSYTYKDVCIQSMMYLFFIYISTHVWLSTRVPILFQKPTKSMTLQALFLKNLSQFWGKLQLWRCPLLLSPAGCPTAWPWRCWRAAALPGHSKLRTEDIAEEKPYFAAVTSVFILLSEECLSSDLPQHCYKV